MLISRYVLALLSEVLTLTANAMNIKYFVITEWVPISHSDLQSMNDLSAVHCAQCDYLARLLLSAPTGSCSGSDQLTSGKRIGTSDLKASG
jgi:hypothetical protein